MLLLANTELLLAVRGEIQRAEDAKAEGGQEVGGLGVIPLTIQAGRSTRYFLPLPWIYTLRRATV